MSTLKNEISPNRGATNTVVAPRLQDQGRGGRVRIGVGVTREYAHLLRCSRLRRGVCWSSSGLRSREKTSWLRRARGASGDSNFGDTRFRARTWKGGDSAMFWQPPPKRRDETRGCHRLCSARSASTDLQSAYASRSADGCRHRIAHLHEIARAPLFRFKTKEWGTRGAINRNGSRHWTRAKDRARHGASHR